VGTTLCPRGGEQRGLAIKLPAHPTIFFEQIYIEPKFSIKQKIRHTGEGWYPDD
jgi:hypothetical protein